MFFCFSACQGILEWVMDSVQKGNKEIQERIILLQKEKDQVGRILGNLMHIKCIYMEYLLLGLTWLIKTNQLELSKLNQSYV